MLRPDSGRHVLAETDAIMEEYGFNLDMTEGRDNACQTMSVFKRHKTEPPIALIFGPDGRLKMKYQESTAEFILLSIRDAFH